MVNSSQQIVLKNLFDIIFSIVLTAILSPVFIMISIAIKLDDGYEVFFKQKRPGLNGKSFIIWKYRTMIPKADSMLDKQGRPIGKGRITRIGKVLRYLSLDELPQLFNIMKREMSFVGPRPGLYEHLDRYNRRQKNRYLMKPGITGLAQIKGRNTLKWSERIEYDLEYIENFSFRSDLSILLKTINCVILREGIVLDRNPDDIDDLPTNASD